MPELPEVQTTVDGLNRTVKGRIILDVETSYSSTNNLRPTTNNTTQIKNPSFFKIFKKKVIGQKILKAERRAKNILIHLTPSTGSTGSLQASSGHNNRYTIIVHMKMTGNLIYNRPDSPFVRLNFRLDNNKTLALSDMRKFAKVTLVKTAELGESPHLGNLGPEPLDSSFQLTAFSLQLNKRPRGKIKQVLMDQSVIAGIGNIYSDEILWRANVHPLSVVGEIPEKNLKLMFTAMKEVLKKGIKLGGDSTSDYRNIKGEKGEFQEHHRAYQRTGETCTKRGCKGTIERTVIGGRSSHFCPVHQTFFK